MDTKFNVTKEIDAWLAQLTDRGHFTREDVRELHAHLLDSVEALEKLGLSQQEAFLVAQHRFGSTASIQTEFHKLSRPFTAQQEPFMLLLGALGFIVGKNIIQTINNEVMLTVAGLWGDSLKTVVAYAAVCVLILLAVVTGLLLFAQRGRSMLNTVLGQFQRRPVGSTAVVGLIIGITALTEYLTHHPADALMQVALNEWTYYQFWTLSNLFWLGLYLSGLVVFLHVVIQHHSANHITLFRWLRQAPIGWRLVAGVCMFVCWLGISLALTRLLSPEDVSIRFYGSAFISCLLNGSFIASGLTHSTIKRLLICLAPIVIWYVLALLATSFSSCESSYLLQSTFVNQFFTAAILGWALSLFFPNIIVDQRATSL